VLLLVSLTEERAIYLALGTEVGLNLWGDRKVVDAPFESEKRVAARDDRPASLPLGR
jgi:hypothetical protein